MSGATSIICIFNKAFHSIDKRQRFGKTASVEHDSSGAFLYSLGLGLITGVALALTVSLGVVYLAVGIGAAAVLIMLGALTRYSGAFLAAIFLAAVCLGALRGDAFVYQQQQQSLLPYVSATGKEKDVVEGVVVNDPERRATSMHVTIAVQKINDDPAQGQLLAILGRDEPVAYGDTLTLQGVIEAPQPFETNTGHLFDYAGYLEAQGISATMPQSVVLGGKHNGFAPHFLVQTVGPQHYYC